MAQWEEFALWGGLEASISLRYLRRGANGEPRSSPTVS